MTIAAVLCLAYVLSQFYRVSIAVIAPELKADLDLDDEGLGRLSAAFFLAFAAAQIPVGIALDRIGPRRTMSGLMLLAVAGSMLFASASDGWTATFAQVLIGLGCAPILMSSFVVIARFLPPSRFAVASATIIAIGNAGNLLGTSPLGVAAEILGWRGALWIVAAITVASTLAVMTFVRDWPPGKSAPTTTETLGEALAGVACVLRIRALWTILPMSLAGNSAVIALRGLWGGPYLTDVHGLDAIGRGNILLAMAAAMVVGALAYGPLDRLFGTRKYVVIGGTTLTMVAIALLALAPDAPLIVVTVLMMAAGACGMTFSVIMAHGRAFVPDRLIGRGMTLLNFASFVGIGMLQWLTGVIARDARLAGMPAPDLYSLLFWTLAGALAVALATYAFSTDAKPGDAKPGDAKPGDAKPGG